MDNNKFPSFVRAALLTILLFGVIGSLCFVFNAGRNNNSILLQGLFIVWVISPFVALLIADFISKQRTLLSRKAIFWLTVIITIGSLVSYSGAFNTPQTKKAFVFLIVPLLSSLFLILTILTTLRLSSKTIHNSLNSNTNSYKIENIKLPIITLLTWSTVAGNALFVLWVTYNGIDEGFKGTLPEKISYITLIGLLTTNVFLILRKKTAIN